jgi:DNA-binding XRE family transcriptional regulator
MRDDTEHWAKEGALRHARAIEMDRRRSEVEAVRVTNYFELLPAPHFHDLDTGRPQLMPDAPLILLGRYLRRSRAYAGLSQTQLASMAGVSQSMVSRVERAKAPAMAFERFVNICLVLGRLFPLGVCPHDHRCGWQPVKPPPPKPDADAFLAQLLLYAGEE